MAGTTSWHGWGFHGFGFHIGTQRGYIAWWRAVVVPSWFLAAVLAIIPPVRIFRWRRRLARRLQIADRILANRCATCGYDLRAHSAGQKCPECGTTVPR